MPGHPPVSDMRRFIRASMSNCNFIQALMSSIEAVRILRTAVRTTRAYVVAQVNLYDFLSHNVGAAMIQRGSPPSQTPAAVRQYHPPDGTAEPPPKKPTSSNISRKKLTLESAFLFDRYPL